MTDLGDAYGGFSRDWGGSSREMLSSSIESQRCKKDSPRESSRAEVDAWIDESFSLKYGPPPL